MARRKRKLINSIPLNKLSEQYSPSLFFCKLLLTCISSADTLDPDITVGDIAMGGCTLEKQEYVPLTESVYYILLAFEKPMHGYAVMQYISEISKERVKMGPGTLYGAIKTLLEKGWIRLVDGKSGSRRKEYVLTELGRETVNFEITRLKELVGHGEDIMRGERNEVDKA